MEEPMDHDEKHEHHDEEIEAMKEKEEKEEKEEKGRDHMKGGINIGKRDLWLLAGGALGALAALGLGKATKKMRPVAVGAVREGYAFKEWLAGKAEKVKEDVEDIMAEGVHQYQQDLSAAADTVKREKDILEKIEKMVEEKLSKMKPEKEEG
jgi:gas vesicle protein